MSEPVVSPKALIRREAGFEVTDIELRAITEMSSAGVQSGFLPEHIKTVAQAKAIAFMGHALGVHPALAWTHSYQIHGRIGFEVLLKLGVVQAKVPTLDLEVIEQTEATCVIEIQRSPSHRRHRIQYTMDRAVREGRTRNPLYKSNPEDMLYKQAVDRALKRVAAAELMGFPPPPEDLALEAEHARAPAPSLEGVAVGSALEVELLKSTAEEVVAEGEKGVLAVGAETPETPPPPKTSEGHTPPEATTAEKLAELMKRLGWTTKAQRLQAASTVMSVITGTPVMYVRADRISPSEIEAIYQHLLKKYPDGPPPPAPSSVDAPASLEAPAPQDPARAVVTEREAAISGDWDAFMGLVERARRVLKGRKFMGQGITDKTKLYYIDLETLRERGYPGSVLLRHGNDLVVAPEELAALARVLRDRCDKEEREGGRNA